MEIAEAVTDLSVLARVVLATPPPSLTVTAVSHTQINVSWADVIGAISYCVYRNGVLVDEPQTPSHSSTGLSPSTLYTFQVSSVGEDQQEGPKSSQFSATTQAVPDTTAPSVPAIAVVTLSSTVQSISLTSASTDSGSGLASYALDRATNSTFTAGLVTTSVAANGFPFTVNNLVPSTQYFYRCRALDGAGNTSGNSGTVSATTQAVTGNQAPVWSGATAIPLTVGAQFSMNFDSGFCADPEGQPVSYSVVSGASALAGAGGTQAGDRGETLNFTPTTPGTYVVTIRASDVQGVDADWASESTAAGVLQAQNFNSADFPTRGDLMDYLLSIEPNCPSNGVRCAYTNVAFGGSQSERYADPVPVGEQEKIGLDTSTYLTGGQSVYMRLRASEGANENGPVIELPILSPAPVYYVRIVYRIDAAVLSHSYDSSHRKICFLNHLNFADGQIVGVLYLDHEPWPLAYRVDGSNTRQLRVSHSSGPSGYGSNFQLFGGYDTNPGGAAPSTMAAWDLRYGPSFDNANASNANFNAVNRPVGDEWYQTEWMIDQSYVGSVSRGMFKSWGAPIGGAPQLQQFCFRDCGFNTFAETPAQSIRLTFRPEDSLSGNPSDAGIRFDSVIVSTNPIKFIGGFTLPNSGQTIPTGQPISGTSDD